MKTALRLFLMLLASAGWLAAQTPPPAAGAITIDPNATNRDAIVRELLRRSMATNLPAAGAPPSLPMSTQPPDTTRTLRPVPTPADATAPSALKSR